MAQFSKLEVLTAMEEIVLIPVFYNKDIEVAVEIASACIRGGAKLVEFTNRRPVLKLIFELNEKLGRINFKYIKLL